MERHLAIANKLLREKKYKDALKLYDKFLHEFPNMRNYIEKNIMRIKKLMENDIRTVTSTGESDVHSGSIAVIIPFYNGSKFIERAILSAKQQTIKPEEIIVVDDGSSIEESNKCKDVCDKYQCYYYYKENGGQGSARNYGVTKASSNYITFLDQDDFYLPHHNEVLLSAMLEEDNLAYVYGDAIEADADGSVVRIGMIKEHSIHPKTKLIHFLGQDMFILPSASLIRRDVFLKAGGFDERLTGYEDDDLFIRLFRSGFSGKFVDVPVYVWCIHTESTSYTIKMSRSRFIYFSKLLMQYPDDPKKNRFYIRDQVVPRFLHFFVREAVISRINNDQNSEELFKIYCDSIDLLRYVLNKEELALHDYLIKIMKYNDRDLLINTLYFGNLLTKYGFVQTFYV